MTDKVFIECQIIPYMEGYNTGVSLSNAYNIFSLILIGLIIIVIPIFIFVKLGINIKILKKITRFSEKHKKGIVTFFLVLLFSLIIAFGFFRYAIYSLDKSTAVNVDEKILIIELDDYWNINETSPYFERYGYTPVRYRSVSDIIDKYGFVATLGVSPQIFVEDVKKDYPLEEDKKMVSYLKELNFKGYELAMHGYNHCQDEYYCPKYEEVWYNILNGKTDIEKILKVNITTYFPPGNIWTTGQYENVKKAGFLIIGNTKVPKAYFDGNVIITPKGYNPIYYYRWYSRNFSYSPYSEWINEYNKKNLFILQLHYNTFDSREKLDYLDKFLAYVKKDGAKVMTYREFYEYSMEKRKSIDCCSNKN
jgi:uncharacterized protein